jgi:hypothetical protein
MLKALGLTPEKAREFEEAGIQELRKRLRKHREEEDEKEKKKSEKGNNWCFILFLLLFLALLLYNKLNEEIWRMYKTRGEELIVKAG